jgi:asparagine synthase (glutamine-hydrolysing)
MSSFCGVVSARVGAETATQQTGISRFIRLCEWGGYCLSLQGQYSSACAGDFGILLDGRIFNKTELAGQLDMEPLDEPELLLFAYRKWGSEFPRYIEGEFAFVLWDRTLARILLGCGPGGNFPLFYAQRGDNFFFARNLRQLLTGMGITPRINENYLARWLALTFCGSDNTFFEDVFRMIPGSILIYEQGRITRNVYWQPEKTPQLRLRDSRKYADGLRDVLTRAIRDRLPDHAAVGSLLSGGLDSSTVTSLTAEILHREKRRLHAFTAVPEHHVDNLEGRFCDEGPAAASVAAMWPNVDHVFVRHGRHSVFKLMDLFGSEQLEPIFNPANYDWVYEICLQARQRQLDTLLVGDSGNMSISYNDRFALHSLASQGRLMALAKLAWEMRRESRRRWRGIAYEALGPWIPLEVRLFIKSARGNFNGLFGYSMIRREFARRHGLDSMAFERSIEHLDSRSLRMRYLRRLEMGTSTDAFRRLTGVLRLDPTADRRVVDFCLSVPVEYYCEMGVPRSLIRNAMTGRLPEQVRTEQRRGQQAADLAIHFKREREEALAELARMKKADLAARALDLEELERMMSWSDAQIEANGGRRGHWPKVMRAFSLGRFLRRFEDGTLFSLSAPQG